MIPLQKKSRLTFITALVIWNLLSSEVPAEIIFEKEEIAVYRTILHQGRLFTKNRILIHEHSTGDTLQAIAHEEKESLMKELNFPTEIFDDWKEKNSSRRKIAKSLNLSIDYDVLTKSEFDFIFQNSDLEVAWRVFAKKYENTDGFIRLSKPGFDKGKKSSLVLVEYHCGPNCGTGRFLSLRKNDSETWVTESSILMWMAY